MRSPWWWAVVLWVVAGLALAAEGGGEPQVEAGMLVSGRIVVGPDGKPSEYQLKDPDRLPAGVRRFLDLHIPRWQFEPPMLEGRAVALDNLMDIHLRAVPEGEGMRLELGSVSFRPAARDTEYELRRHRLIPPEYPRAALAAGDGGGAVVYVALRIGPDGKVVEAVDEQVNLHFIPDAGSEGKWRDLFARNALRAARAWTFQPPTRGELAGLPYWRLRVPVHYIPSALPGAGDQYGKWQAYVVGPWRQVDWFGEADVRQPLESLAGNTLHVADAPGQLKLVAQAGG